jgi:hypothetical protein
MSDVRNTLEQHYRATQIADRWNLSPDTIRDLFADEPGVLKIERPETMHKRGYTSLRIPESVVERVRLRLAA